jgi:hypothetical protein
MIIKDSLQLQQHYNSHLMYFCALLNCAPLIGMKLILSKRYGAYPPLGQNATRTSRVSQSTSCSNTKNIQIITGTEDFIFPP